MTEETPCSEEAEKGILSCFFQAPELLEDARVFIPDRYFFNKALGTIYGVMLEMNSQKSPIDFITVTDWCISKGIIEQVGGRASIVELSSYLNSSSHYAHYRGILKEKSALRDLIELNSDCIKSAYSCASQEASKLIARHAIDLTNLAKVSVPKKKSMQDHVEEWMDEWQKMYGGEKASGIPTRWSDFNYKCGGIKPGYTVVSGRRASGKSCLAYNMVVDYCLKQDKPGIIKNYEMPVKMTLNRLIADIGSVPAEHLFYPDRFPPNEEMLKRIQQARDMLLRSKLEIIHDVTMDIESVIDMARQKKASEGDCLVAIDYIQIAPDPRRKKRDQNREQDVAKNSAICRAASKELDIPLIVLSQLNNDGTTRESSAIEQDADDVYRIDSEKGVFIHKQRNGPSDEYLPLFLNGPYLRFQKLAA